MAKKKKGSGKRSHSRKGHKKAKGKKGRASARKSGSLFGKILKDAAVLGAGAIGGALIEATGYLPDVVSGPAVGTAIAGLAVTKGKVRGVATLALASAVGLQGYKTVTGHDMFASLEAKVHSAVGGGKEKKVALAGKSKGAASKGGGALGGVGGAVATLDQTVKQAQSEAGQVQGLSNDATQAEKTLSLVGSTNGEQTVSEAAANS
jgi:hypothetical protein